MHTCLWIWKSALHVRYKLSATVPWYIDKGLPSAPGIPAEPCVSREQSPQAICFEARYFS